MKKIKKAMAAIISIANMLTFTMGECPHSSFNTAIKSYAYTAHTRDEAVAWVRAQEGVGIDYDGAYGNQCVDLIKAYYAYLGVTPTTGNGKDYAVNALPDGWIRIPNMADFVPEAGDILVWTNGKYGHVAIYLDGDVHNIYSMDQNWGSDYCKIVHHEGYNGVWGVIRPDFKEGSHLPEGYLDVVEGGEGYVTVSGWALDRDDVNKALNIHIYMDGPAGIGTCVASDIYANEPRPDVNEVIGVGGDHGFTSTIRLNVTGEHKFYAYAINIGPDGTNPSLNGEYTANIKPAQKPNITKVGVSHVTKDGFRVEVDVTNASEIKIPVWSHKSTNGNWQDDLVWHKGIKYNDSHWYCDVAVKDHKNDYGKYAVDIYAYNANGDSDEWRGENNKRTTATIGIFKLNYDANNGTVSPASKEVTYKEKMGTLAAPTRKGYNFNGWYTAKTDGTKVDANVVYNEFKDTTIYAQWSPIEYTVTLDANGGTVSPQTLKVKMDSAYGTLPTPTRKGYNFNGWYTAKTGGTKIESTTKFTAAANPILYAQWKAIPVTTTTTTKPTTTTTTTTTKESVTTTTTAPQNVELEIGKQYILPVVSDDTGDYIFKSSNTDIAVVSKKGVITGISKGKCTIFAINSDGEGIYNITISVEQEATTTTVLSEPLIYGDANNDGKVSVADAVAILQFIGNKDKYNLSDTGKKNADVDGVAGITGKDALVIQQVDAGLYTLEDLPLKAT